MPVAIVNGYCTEQEVRDQFGDDGSKLTQEIIGRAVNATSRSIDRFCGRRFWQDASAVARVYKPRGPYTVYVHDISTTSGLIVATDTTEDGTYDTTWDSADYQVEPLGADADGGAYAWWQITAIDDKTFPLDTLRPRLQVTAQGGWSAFPDEINQAAILKASSLFKRKDAPFGIAGFADFGAVRITRKDPDVMGLLEPFIRIARPEI